MSITHELFELALARELALLAKEIQRKRGCSDQDAIDEAMKEYNRLVVKFTEDRRREEERVEKYRAEQRLRAEGQSTLKASFGDLLRAKAKK